MLFAITSALCRHSSPADPAKGFSSQTIRDLYKRKEGSHSFMKKSPQKNLSANLERERESPTMVYILCVCAAIKTTSMVTTPSGVEQRLFAISPVVLPCAKGNFEFTHKMSFFYLTSTDCAFCFAEGITGNQD